MNRISSILSLMLFFDLAARAEDKIMLLFGKAENSSTDTIILSNHYGRYTTTTGQVYGDMTLIAPLLSNKITAP